VSGLYKYKYVLLVKSNMNDPTILMIVMLLVVVVLMMSRDTHKLFAETTRTWAQFGSSNYKAISALTAAALFAIGGGMYKNKLLIEELEAKTYFDDFKYKAMRVHPEIDDAIDQRSSQSEIAAKHPRPYPSYPYRSTP
jgi:uncharacterized membrane protein